MRTAQAGGWAMLGVRAEDEEQFDRAREEMVRRQIEARGIHDEGVLAAMRIVPRHRFVPGHVLGVAYRDSPLPIGHGQTISQPYIVAYMTAKLALTGSEKVLEIGTGSGYQAAILGCLAREVVTVERLPGLAKEARTILAELHFDNVHVRVSDGSLGWPEESPYDAIMVTAAAPEVPVPLQWQLADGGRLVAPVGPRWTQQLVRVRREGDRFHTDMLLGVAFVPLIGKHGWHDRGSVSLGEEEIE
jgi:protein-L-isoaspartate(D-aspartate) O-methyltransferase